MELLRTVVDATGVPRQMAIARPIGFGLDEKAVDADQELTLPSGDPERPAGTGGGRSGRHFPHLLQPHQTRFGGQGVEGDGSSRFGGGYGQPGRWALMLIWVGEPAFS